MEQALRKRKPAKVLDLNEKIWDKRYTQYYDKQMKELAKLNVKNPLAGSIFLLFASSMGRDDINSVQCEHEHLMEFFNKSRTSVWRALKVLKDMRYFTSVFKSGSMYTYVLNSDIVWKTYVDGRPISVMNTAIIMSNRQLEELRNNSFPEEEIEDEPDDKQ